MAFGTPGGDNQDQWTVTFLLRLLHHGMGLQEAIDAPAFQSAHVRSSFYPRDSSPQEVLVETRLPEATLAELERRGHRVTRAGDWALGRISAATRDDSRLLRAAANPRGMQGYAVGR